MTPSHGQRRSPGRLTRAIAASLGLALCFGAGVASASEGRDPDPWEPMNRGIFWFNEKTDMWVLAPAARGWRFITPSFVRTGISNFNNNLTMPVDFANNVIQLKPADAGYDALRMIYNTTMGLGGFIDIATMIEIPQSDEDFGQSLGYWGVPPGPYLVLPLFGPSNVRDGVGRLGDTAATFYFSLLPFWSTFIVRGVEIVNLRTYYLEEIDENRRESFDYYVFMRNAYLQNRIAKVGRERGADGASDTSRDDDLYYFDEEWDDDLEGDEGEDGTGDAEGAPQSEDGAMDASEMGDGGEEGSDAAVER